VEVSLGKRWIGIREVLSSLLGGRGGGKKRGGGKYGTRRRSLDKVGGTGNSTI